jgi:hypothetical protein
VGVVASPAYRTRMQQHGIGSIEPDEAMPVLANLLASDVRQAAFVQLTDAQAASLGALQHVTFQATEHAPSVLETLDISRVATQELLEPV